MANADHLSLLRKGSIKWNAWRKDNPEVVPDLTEADLKDVHSDVEFPSFEQARTGRAHPERICFNLREAQMQGARLAQGGFSCADFERANLRGADLTGNHFDTANFRRADLSGARLVGASFRMFKVSQGGSICITNDLTNLSIVNGQELIKTGAILEVSGSDFSEANLRDCDMREAKLNGSKLIAANLTGADLRDADLSRVDLSDAVLVGANLQSALLVDARVHRTKFNGAFVYGISAWNLDFEDTEQSNLVITPPGEPLIAVDNIEVAQFVYLLVKNPKIRDVINTIGQKSVLILGRFGERKSVLDAIREALRQHGYLPIVFDFERPDDRDFTETVMTLAGMSRFIVADITKPKSVPLELQAIVPNFMIPFVPLIEAGEEPFAMFVDLRHKYGDWILEPVAYSSVEGLLKTFDKVVIKRANETLMVLKRRKAESLVIRNVDDFVDSASESSGASETR